MHVLTQGTVITGMRSQKYKNANCFGIVISARCDLANCKASKIYYLTGVSVDDWLFSSEGFKEVLSSRIKSFEEKLQSKVEEVELDWETLRAFSVEEFCTVIENQELGLQRKQISTLKNDFEAYKKYTSDTLTVLEKVGILNEQNSSVVKYLSGLANGAVTHYTYIPEDAYFRNSCSHKGMIVDLQELEYMSLETSEVLSRGEMDIKCLYLKNKDKQKYNEQFFLDESPGYAMAKCDMSSPWIEYLMQRFSNSFIRIGVDGPQKEQIQSMLDRICTNIAKEERV